MCIIEFKYHTFKHICIKVLCADVGKGCFNEIIGVKPNFNKRPKIYTHTHKNNCNLGFIWFLLLLV